MYEQKCLTVICQLFHCHTIIYVLNFCNIFLQKIYLFFTFLFLHNLHKIVLLIIILYFLGISVKNKKSILSDKIFLVDIMDEVVSSKVKKLIHVYGGVCFFFYVFRIKRILFIYSVCRICFVTT